MRILCAETDDNLRGILQKFLEDWGYEVTAVADGDQACLLLQQSDGPRIVILDWMLPGIRALTLCRKLHTLKRTVPVYVILLSEPGKQDEIFLGLEAGADDYIKKPFGNEELLARIRVGERILDLTTAVATQKLQGVLEMAGAICHELNQPLHVVLGYSEMLLQELHSDTQLAETLRSIKTEIDRIGELTRRIMRITAYKTKNYLDGRRTIVDLRWESEDGPGDDRRVPETGKVKDGKENSGSR